MNEDFDIRKSRIDGDNDFERALRRSSFDDFNGQDKIIENLRVFVKAARLRGESLDHTLLYGLLASAKPLCQTSWLTNWAWASR